MLIRPDFLTVVVPWKHFALNFRFSVWQKWQTGWKMLSTAMFVYKNVRLEAVPPHLVYIIKFFVAHQIAYSHCIPVHISDISLAENRKLTQKIWETGLNCLSLRTRRKCDYHEVMELDQMFTVYFVLFLGRMSWMHQTISFPFHTILLLSLHFL